MASVGYRVIEPTGVAATDTAAWQAAIASGSDIWLSNTGQPLRLTATTAMANRRFRIEGNDVEIEQAGNVIPINIEYGLGTAYTV